jgi:glycogen(starch) synthase
LAFGDDEPGRPTRFVRFLRERMRKARRARRLRRFVARQLSGRPRPLAAIDARRAPPRFDPRPGEGQVTVVVSTYNRAERLNRLLLGLQRLRHLSFEVVVVAGPSKDDTEAVLQSWADKIRRYDCPDVNLAKSRNIGLCAATGEFVAFIDDDAVPEPDWIDRLLEPMSDRQIAATGGPIRDRSGINYQSRVLMVDDLARLRPADGLRRLFARQREQLALTGTNFCVRSEWLFAAGGFDERFSYYLEETDLLFRLEALGGRSAFVDAAEVHHESAASPIRDADRLPTDFGVLLRSLTLFCKQHARRADRNAAIARRIGDQLAQIEGHVFHLADRGVIARVAAAALFRSALRGVWQAVRLPPAPLLCEFGGRDRGAFKRFPIAAPVGGRLRFAVASSAHPDAGETAALESLAAALASAGHEVSLALPGSGEARVEFRDGYWRHFASATRAAANGALPRAVIDEFARVFPRRAFQFVVATRREGGRVAYSLYRASGSVANLRLVAALSPQISDAAAQIEARAAAIAGSD